MDKNNSTLVTGKKPSRFRLTALIAMAVASVVPAFATDPAPVIDFGPAVTATKTEITTFFTSNATALVSLMVVGIVFGIGWRLIKRGAKTIG